MLVICPKLPVPQVVGHRRDADALRAGVAELGMIEQVEELRAELQHGVFVNAAHASALAERDVELDLARSQQRSDAGVAQPVPPVPETPRGRSHDGNRGGTP